MITIATTTMKTTILVVVITIATTTMKTTILVLVTVTIVVVAVKMEAAVDNSLCMKNGGTQWTMVSYLKKIKLKYKREKDILGNV